MVNSHPFHHRGFAQIYLIWALAALALGTGAVTFKKGFAIFSSADTAQVKQQAADLAAADARARTAETEAARLRAESDRVNAALADAEKKRHAAAAEDIAGTVYALEKEDAPSLNVQAALSLSRSAFRNSDPVAESRLSEMRAFVDRLTAENAAIRKTAFDALAAKDAELAVEREKENATAVQARALEAEKKAAADNAVALATKLSAEITDHARDAASLQTLGQKLASFSRWALVASILFVALLWGLPIVARAFPGVAWLGWVAKKGGVILAGGLHALHSGETKLATEGLQNAGRALAAFRAEAPQLATRITQIFDSHVTDPRQQAIVAAAAKPNGQITAA